MSKWLGEVVVLGGVALSIAFVVAGRAAEATATFTAVIGYVVGRQQKVNGELAAIVNGKKK